MILKRISLLFVVATILTSCANKKNKDDIPVLGLDEQGNSIVRYMPKGKYIKKYSPLMNQITNESNKVLERHSQNKPWKLKRVTIGMEFVFEAEFGPIYKFEFVPAVELRFQPLPRPQIN